MRTLCYDVNVVVFRPRPMKSPCLFYGWGFFFLYYFFDFCYVASYVAHQAREIRLCRLALRRGGEKKRGQHQPVILPPLRLN